MGLEIALPLTDWVVVEKWLNICVPFVYTGNNKPCFRLSVDSGLGKVLQGSQHIAAVQQMVATVVKPD